MSKISIKHYCTKEKKKEREREKKREAIFVVKNLYLAILVQTKLPTKLRKIELCFTLSQILSLDTVLVDFLGSWKTGVL